MILRRVSLEKQQITLLKTFDANTVSLATNNNNNAVLTFTEEHGLASLKRHNALNGGSGHTNGTYYNIKLFNSNAVPSSAVWNGATADVTVSGGCSYICQYC